MGVLIDSLASAQSLALPANSTGYVFGLDANTTRTEPTGDGIVTMGWQSDRVPNAIRVHPFAEGSPGQAFGLRVYAWNVFGSNPSTWVWTRSILAQVLCIIGVQRGFPGAVIQDQERFAGYVSGMIGSVSVYNPPPGGVACATVPIFGSHKIQFEFSNGNIPIAMNALWARA